MTHEEALNHILSHACPHSEGEPGESEFILELHCATMKVVAKPLGNLKYDIISVTRVDKEG